MSVTREEIIAELERRAKNGDAEAQRALGRATSNMRSELNGSTASNFAKGAGRGVTATLGLPGDAGNLLKQTPYSGSPISNSASRFARAAGGVLDYAPSTAQLRGFADKAVDLLPGADPNASIFKGGEDTLAGRVGEFTGGAAAFGLPGVAKQTVQSGLKTAVKNILQPTKTSFLGAPRSLVRGSQAAAAGAASYGGEQAFGMPGALIGAFAPGAIFATAKAPIKGLLRGFGRVKSTKVKEGFDEILDNKHVTEVMQQNIDDIVRQGGVATVGSTSPVRRAGSIETIIETQPGAVAKFFKVGEENARGLQKRLADLLKLRGFNDAAAGMYITSALKTATQSIRLKSRKLYNQAERLITNPNAQFDIKETTKTLQKLSGQAHLGNKWDEVLNTVKTSDELAGDLLEQIYMTANASSSVATRTLNPVLMPWNAVNELRKRIGQQISLRNFQVGDPHQGVLREIYRALATDLEIGARIAGGGAALNAFKKANAHWRSARKRMDYIISPLLKQETIPEKVFRSAVAGNLQNQTALKEITKGMSPFQQEMVVKRFVAKLGKLSDETGEIVSMNDWSPGRMLSNWNKIEDSSKTILFNTKKLKRLRNALDDYFAVLEKQKEAASILANPSGTAGRGLAAMTGNVTMQNALRVLAQATKLAPAAAVGAGVAGPGGAAASVAASAASFRALAQLFTSDKFVRWLAKPVVDSSQLPAHIARLNIIAQSETDPETIEALATFNNALISVMEHQGVQ